MIPFKCPRCRGCVVEQVEDVSISRIVKGFNEDDVLILVNEYRIHDEGGDNMRLHCHDCDFEWPISKGQEIEYV